MLKDLVTSIFGIIKGVSAIKWVDEDFGQIDRNDGERPAVIFPCALVNLNVNGDHIAGDEYNYNNIINVRVAHNRIGDRSAMAADTALGNTLSKMDDVDAVKDAFVEAGYYFKTMVTEVRGDGLAVHVLTFGTYNE